MHAFLNHDCFLIYLAGSDVLQDSSLSCLLLSLNIKIALALSFIQHQQ